MEEGVWILLALGYALLPFFGLAAFLQVRSLRDRVTILEARLRKAGETTQAGTTAPLPPDAATEMAPEAMPERSIPADVLHRAMAAEMAAEMTADMAEGDAPPPPVSPPPPPPPPADPTPPAPPRADLESRLTGRWLVWIGGLALALGGAFLVQVSIESGLLGPGPRVLLGLLLAAVLIGAGERLRRHPPARAVGRLGSDQLAPSATGAGLLAAYAAIFAAYGLYGLIGPLVGFGGLALVSLVAVGMGILHGAPVAALGMVGALAVPVLIGGKDTSGIGLFSYLAAVTVVTGLTARWRGWNWAVLLVHGGGMVYVAAHIILNSGLRGGPPWAAGLFVILAAAGVATLRRRRPVGGGWLERIDIGGMVLAGLTIAQACFVLGDVGSVALLALLAAAVTAALFADDRRGGRASGGAIAAIPLLAVAGWALEGYPLHETALLGPFGILTAAGLALAGFVAAHGSHPHGNHRAAYFTLAGAGGSLLLLAHAYALATSGTPDPDWALLAAAVAALHTGLAVYAARHRDDPQWGQVLAGHATAALAALALGASFILRDAWLTVALAWTVTAAAYVHRFLPYASLRGVALALALAAIVRLSGNPFVLWYPLPEGGWFWYGYGLSIAAFLTARHLFGARLTPLLRTALEGGALSFLVLLVSLQIRLWTGDGPLDRWSYSLLEQGLNSLWWLGLALFLFVRSGTADTAVHRWGWRILGTIGAAQVITGHLLANNPLFTGDPVGAVTLVNLLFLLYAVPAVLAAGFAAVAGRRGLTRLSMAAGVAALALTWMWLTLEVRHAAHGTVIHESLGVTDGELYAYSAVWLGFGGVLLALGLWRDTLAFRYASLVVVLLTVAKVFLIDMAALTGLWRAVSFIGLGAVLLLIGFVYQRFVLVRRAQGG